MSVSTRPVENEQGKDWRVTEGTASDGDTFTHPVLGALTCGASFEIPSGATVKVTVYDLPSADHSFDDDFEIDEQTYDNSGGGSAVAKRYAASAWTMHYLGFEFEFTAGSGSVTLKVTSH